MLAIEMPELEAIQKAGSGDGDAYKMLYRQHQANVYSLCLRMTRNVSDAEDITQDVFLQLFRKLTSFRGDARLGTWLYRITVNCTLMHLRERHRTGALATEEAIESDVVPAGAKPEAKASASPTNRLVLEQAMNSLTVEKRSVLLLHDFTGFTHREIADRLGLSITGSKSRLHRAHREMRALLCD